MPKDDMAVALAIAEELAFRMKKVRLLLGRFVLVGTVRPLREEIVGRRIGAEFLIDLDGTEFEVDIKPFYR